MIFQNTGAPSTGPLVYNEPNFDKTVFSSQIGSRMVYYFVQGENPCEIITPNHKLTGKAPVFTKATCGFWQCRERYQNKPELLENAKEMRKSEVPVDYIVQNWFSCELRVLK